MNDAYTDILSAVPGPSWLTGPIFDKELRVSSRRRRIYVLRSAYILLLTIFILYAWFIAVKFRGGGAFQVSRMAGVGTSVITTIVWFQFVAAQLIAIVMLSTSISAEIRQRTLGVLLTTPISSLQLVMGKLLSQLLQTMLLLGISLPLLAVVRVMGGVPWDYVISSLFITLTAALFAGSLSLLISIHSKNAYAVVLTITVGYLIVFGALPGFIGVFGFGVFGGRVGGILGSILFQCNPFVTLLIRTNVMLSLPGRAGTFSSWQLHCAIMLVATACVIALAVWRVRRVALAEVFGGRRRRRNASPIRRVEGAPIVWKELRKPFSRKGKRDIILYAILGGMIVISFVPRLFGGIAGGRTGMALLSYVARAFSLIAIVRLAVLSAASITREKEARTWPILLATPIGDTEILRGKAIGAFRRNLPLLIVLVAFRMLSWLITIFSGFPLGILLLYLIQEAVTLAGAVVLVIGVGLYFGVRLKTTNAAVAATVGVYGGLAYFCCGTFSSLLFYPITMIGGGINTFVLAQMVRAVLYVGLGVLGLRHAKRRLRYAIF